MDSMDIHLHLPALAAAMISSHPIEGKRRRMMLKDFRDVARETGEGLAAPAQRFPGRIRRPEMVKGL